MGAKLMGFEKTTTKWLNHQLKDNTLGGYTKQVKTEILNLIKEDIFVDDVREKLEVYFD